MVVAAHFESDEDEDDGVEQEVEGSDGEMSEGGSRRPIFIRRPCGRGPNGKEWDPNPSPNLNLRPTPNPHPHPHPHPNPNPKQVRSGTRASARG